MSTSTWKDAASARTMSTASDQSTGRPSPYQPPSSRWPDSTKPTRKEVTARYERNGYEWDIHGSLFMPEKERDSGIAVVEGTPDVQALLDAVQEEGYEAHLAPIHS